MNALDIIGRALETVDRQKVDPVDPGRSVESTVIPFENQHGRQGRPGRPEKTAAREQSETKTPPFKRWRVSVRHDDGRRTFDMLTPASHTEADAIDVARFHFTDRLISVSGVAA